MLKRLINNKHFQAALDQGGVAAIALVSFMILTRTQSQESFGNWVLYLTILTFVDMLKAGLVKTAYIKFASGKKESERSRYLSASWVLSLMAFGIIILLSVFIYIAFGGESEVIDYFCIYYPIYSLVSLPFYYHLWTAQVILSFKEITKHRSMNVLMMLGVALLSFLGDAEWFDYKVLVKLHVSTFFISSVWVSIKTGWKFFNLSAFVNSDLKKYWDFSRFHILAFLGSNLLRSSDVFLLAYFKSPVLVALYSIPLRLLEVIEMPLKSAVQVAFPVLSKSHNSGNVLDFKRKLSSYTGVLTLLYVPFMLVLFFLSPVLIQIVGGESYEESISVFQIFVLFGLFLPFDRMTGISLDALGMPKLNFIKVLLMASVNIAGNLVAILLFDSLDLVALATVLNVLTGSVFGYYFLKKHIGFDWRMIFSQTNQVIRSSQKKVQKQLQIFKSE